MKRTVMSVTVILLFLPLIFGNIFCGEGSEPETVIVPVGEPGEGDPYGAAGMDCGDDDDDDTQETTTSAIMSEGYQGSRIVLRFTGTEKSWDVQISYPELQAAALALSERWSWLDFSDIEPEEVDALRSDMCGETGERTEQGSMLYTVLQKALGARFENLKTQFCE